MIKLRVQCDVCGGAGLYCGFMEREGEAVVCVRCGGQGYQDLKFNEFTGRKRKNGVRRIRRGGGTIVDNPKQAQWITYEEFEKLIPGIKLKGN